MSVKPTSHLLGCYSSGVAILIVKLAIVLAG